MIKWSLVYYFAMGTKFFVSIILFYVCFQFWNIRPCNTISVWKNIHYCIYRLWCVFIVILKKKKLRNTIGKKCIKNAENIEWKNQKCLTGHSVRKSILLNKNMSVNSHRGCFWSMVYNSLASWNLNTKPIRQFTVNGVKISLYRTGKQHDPSSKHLYCGATRTYRRQTISIFCGIMLCTQRTYLHNVPTDTARVQLQVRVMRRANFRLPKIWHRAHDSTNTGTRQVWQISFFAGDFRAPRVIIEH